MEFKDLFHNPIDGKQNPPQGQGDHGGEENECQYLVLLPRWDSVDDIGNEDKIVGYDCNTCKASFTLKEAGALRRAHHAMKL